MAYVTGCTFDIFVSYATVDNDASDGGMGWVDVLVDKLRRQLQRRLGGRDLDIFLDHALIRSNLPLSSQLLDAVRSSATLLVVMSPSYLKSAWCDRERRGFLDLVKEREIGSMFVVHTCPLDRDEQPEEFRDLIGTKFFTPVEGAARYRLLGEPDPNERLFVDRIIALSGELTEQLQRCRAQQGDLPRSHDDGAEPPDDRCRPAPATGKRVFVAAATDDLEDREAELRSYLMQAGLEVLPSPHSRYPMTDLATYEAAVLHELEGCCLFAQVLSKVHGKDLPFAPGRRLPELQYGLAKRANKPVLQWRDRSQAIDTVQDPAHHALLDAAQACGIEEFKRTVAERALSPPPELEPRLDNSSVAIFVNADARDHGLALDVSRALAELGVDCYWMPDKGSPTDIRAALEKNVRECDGIILVYGKTEFYWVQEQLRQARKLISVHNSHLSTMAVFEGPPAEKPEIPVTIKNLDVLDCRNGLDLYKLRGFVEHLRK